MLFQNIPYSLSRKEQIGQVMAKLRAFMDKYGMTPTQIQFVFDDHYTVKASPCERAIKAYPDLKPYLKEVTDQTLGTKKVLSNRKRSSEELEEIESGTEKSIPFKIFYEIMEGVPRRFAFNNALVTASNVYWKKSETGNTLEKHDQSSTGFMIRIASSWWVNGRMSNLGIQIETPADASGNAVPLPPEMMEDLAAIGKIDKKKMQTFSPEKSVEKMQTMFKQALANAPKAAALKESSKDLNREMRERLKQLYELGKFPHRLENTVVLRKYEEVLPDGRRAYQPPEWVPIECVFASKEIELPSSLTARMEPEERRRQQSAIDGIGELKVKIPVAQAIIDGVPCNIWPYLVKPEKAIPRKKIVMSAFKGMGYKDIETGNGSLTISKETNDYSLQISFDFGTWSRKTTMFLKMMADGMSMSAPIICWLEPGILPILNQSFFDRTMQNAAYSARVIEEEYVPKMLELMRTKPSPDGNEGSIENR